MITDRPLVLHLSLDLVARICVAQMYLYIPEELTPKSLWTDHLQILGSLCSISCNVLCIVEELEKPWVSEGTSFLPKYSPNECPVRLRRVNTKHEFLQQLHTPLACTLQTAMRERVYS